MMAMQVFVGNLLTIQFVLLLLKIQGVIAWDLIGLLSPLLLGAAFLILWGCWKAFCHWTESSD